MPEVGALEVSSGGRLIRLSAGRHPLASLEIARVNLPVGLLIWLMVFPMMVNIDLGSLRQIGARPKGLAITLVVNWLIKPFTMAGLGVLSRRGLGAMVDAANER